MAKNWTVSEAVAKIKENDLTSIQDIGRRFPLFEHLCAKVISGDGEAFVELMNHMPEYMTVGKVEKLLKAEISGEVEDGDEAEEVEEKTEEKPKRGRGKKAEKKEEEDTEDEDADEAEKSYEDMTAQELFKLCKSRKIKAEPKQKASAYIKLLKAADKAAEAENEDDDWGDEEEPEEKKPAKKAEKKTEKKAPKKDDDDDDWDI